VEQLDLGDGRPLLGTEGAGGVHEARADVARHHQLDPAQPADRLEGPQRPQPAVDGGRAPHAHDDPAAPGVQRRPDQLAGAVGRGGHRVVAGCAADELEPGGERHLHHGRPARSPPTGLDGIAQRAGHQPRAVRAAEHLEGPLTPVGHGHHLAGGAGSGRRRGDGGSHLRRGSRPPELVGSGEHVHPQWLPGAPEDGDREPGGPPRGRHRQLTARFGGAGPGRAGASTPG
jgi:hypothetical protein